MKRFFKRLRRNWNVQLPAAYHSSDSRYERADEKRILSILTDIDNGQEFYVSIVDSFPFAGRDYIAASVYEPTADPDVEPEFILMRTDTGADGERYFQSIRNSRELDAVFNIFFERYVDNLREG